MKSRALQVSWAARREKQPKMQNATSKSEGEADARARDTDSDSDDDVSMDPHILSRVVELSTLEYMAAHEEYV